MTTQTKLPEALLRRSRTSGRRNAGDDRGPRLEDVMIASQGHQHLALAIQAATVLEGFLDLMNESIPSDSSRDTAAIALHCVRSFLRAQAADLLGTEGSARETDDLDLCRRTLDGDEVAEAMVEAMEIPDRSRFTRVLDSDEDGSEPTRSQMWARETYHVLTGSYLPAVPWYIPPEA